MKILKTTLFLFFTCLTLHSLKISGSACDTEKPQDANLQRMYSVPLDDNSSSNQIVAEKNKKTPLVKTSRNSCCCINPYSQEYADRYEYDVDATSPDDIDNGCLCCCFYPISKTCCSNTEKS